MKLKLILLGVLIYFGVLLYQAEEHLEHLVEAHTAEIVYEHYN